MVDADYFAHEAISNSDMNLFRRSPAHLWAHKYAPECARIERAETPAMRDGHMLHMAILEPERFADSYCVMPEDAPRRPTSRQINAKNPSPESKFAVEYWEAFSADNPGREIIEAAKMQRYLDIAESVSRHPEVRVLLSSKHAVKEMAFIGHDPDTSLLCKCKVDLQSVVGQFNVLVDFKSTDDARPHPFQGKAWKYGYFHQAAFYPMVVEWAGYGPVDTFLFVVFEKDPPYGIKVYEPGDMGLEYARCDIRSCLRDIKDCLNRTDGPTMQEDWPAYSTAVETLYVPSWAAAELNHE